MKRFVAASIVCAVLTGTLAGCAGKNAQGANAAQSQTQAAFETPDYTPRAVIDQNGYGTGAEKIVIFLSGDAGDAFEIRAVANDAVVYTGAIKAAENGDDVCFGQFSSFQTAGEYYVYTDALGASYAFRISDALDTQSAQSALKLFYLRRCGTALDAAYAGKSAREACHTSNARLQLEPTLELEAQGGWHTDELGGRDVIAACNALRDLTLSYEISADKYDDAAGIPESGNGVPDVLDEARYEIEWLIKMQAPSGGVYGGVLTGGNEHSANLTLTEVSPEATVCFAGALAKFAYVYEEFDAAYAHEALDRAQEAWAYFASTRSPLQERAAFFAAAELYRLTGDRKYENVLSAFFNREDYDALFAEDDEVFYGSVAYLNTRQPVNVTVRNDLNRLLRASAERIVERAKKSDYFVSDEEIDALLQNMCRLAVMNSVSYSHEYATIIEDHAHYLYGRNPDAVNYVTTGTERTYLNVGVSGVTASIERCAKLALALRAI